VSVILLTTTLDSQGGEPVVIDRIVIEVLGVVALALVVYVVWLFYILLQDRP
jgi:hypothetical protein